MGMKICGAPCSWGIDTLGNPFNPSWERVVKEAHEVGYRAIELGPYGYFPVNETERVTEILEQNNLGICVGVIFDELLTEKRYLELREQVEQICRFITKLPPLPVEPGQKKPTPYITLMDFGHDERNSVAGHSDLAPRADREKWSLILRHIRGLAEIANELGVRAVVHPHSGGYIEFDDEVEMLLNDISEKDIGLCLDTGHITYAGGDAAKTLVKYRERLEYVHFKDLNEPVYRDAMNRKLKFLDACHEGAFVPIGKGMIDYPAVRAALDQIDYNGYICIEQERDPRTADEAKRCEGESIAFLKANGFEI